MWMAANRPTFIVQGAIYGIAWVNTLTLASYTASMIVNALVTGLIVYRIFKVFHEVITSSKKSLGVTHTGRRRLRSAIFIIIESGMTLFVIQLARLVISATWVKTDTENDIYELVTGIHNMLNVIISSVIVYSILY